MPLPCPATLEDKLLIEWIKNENPGFVVGADASRIDPDQGILFGTEGAYAGLVHRDRRSLNCVSDVDAACDRPCSRDESVAALAAAGGIAVVA